MMKAPTPVDIRADCNLVRLAEEVVMSGTPRVLRRTGMMIGARGILIAATALHYELAVVTCNVRHFDRVPGLLPLPDRFACPVNDGPMRPR